MSAENPTTTAVARKKYKPRRRDFEWTCLHCGNPFRGQANQLYCDESCSRKAAERRKTLRPLENKCLSCGSMFPVARSRGRMAQYCSTKCSDGANYHYRPESKTLLCLFCGKSFLATRHANKRRHCSGACRIRMGSQIRQCLITGAFVEPVDIGFLIARDKGICQLCGRPVDLAATAPSPESPTIDHVIPLSKGGRHEKANCHLAHWRCNSAKCNRPAVWLF